MQKIILTIGGVVAVGIVTMLAVMYSGMFNVAAGWKDPGLMHWLLVTTRHNSISSRAADIQVPSLTEPKQIDNGFRSYREMCATCHTPPGAKDSPITKGMNPPPPDLAKSAKHMSDAEIFWVTKNGIRMTGMPAWGETHGDEELWDIIAFVKILPDMSKTKYTELDKRLPPGHAHADGEGHGDSAGHGHDDIGHDDSHNNGHKKETTTKADVHIHADGKAHEH